MEGEVSFCEGSKDTHKQLQEGFEDDGDFGEKIGQG